MAVGKNKHGRFYFSVWYTDVNGVYRQKKTESTIWRTKKEAKEAEDLFLKSFRAPNNRITYNELFDAFINNRNNRIKSRSMMTYKDVHSLHILPEFGKKQISNITKEQIRSWQKRLQYNGYSNDYLKTIQSNFRRVLNWGVNNDFIETNPFTIDYIKGSSSKKEMLFFTLEEFEQFSDVIEDPTDFLIFNILYWTGVRKGELQALTFGDVDTINKTIVISKNYDYRNHKVSTPKTKTSYREIMIPDQLNNLLINHISQCKNLAGYSPGLFLIGIDKPLSSTTLERKKNKYCKEAHIKQIRIHDFRHSHVSLLINSEVNDFDIAKRLGHSRDLVNNTYGHWFKKNQEKLVNKLNEISTKKPSETKLYN